jgi:hypothetical protein
VRKIYKQGTVLGTLAAAMLLATATGAMAATEPTQSPEGFGIQATGLLGVTAQPIATAATPTPSCVATVGASILTANAVCAAVNGNQTTAAVGGLSALGLGSAISAGAITSSCIANSNGTFTLASNVAGLTIGGVAFADANATPNDTITIPLVGSITFNQQVIPGPVTGSETVNALVINIAGENITLASATCGPFDASAPVAGGKGLVLGLGALGAGAVGVTAVKLNRRRRLTSA